MKSIEYKDRSIDIANAGGSDYLQIYNTNRRWFQMWRLKGDHIVNEKGKVFDVKKGDEEGASINVADQSDEVSQKF